MAEPLVSVITPTWHRAGLLIDRCIPSVQKQSHRRVEHIIVSDGPDQELTERAGEVMDRYLVRPVTFAYLAEHDPSARWGHRARVRGAQLAHGEYIAWLDDDNAFRPHHLSAVVGEMERTGAGFGYSQALFHGNGAAWVVGAAPPSYGQIDTSVLVHRRELLDVASWRDEGQETVDWDLVHRWLLAGAEWAFVQEITVDYHVTG